MNKKGLLYVISGSSGVGKGTLLKLFLEQNKNVKLSVSCTTRKPRPQEVDGVNYFFVSEEEFNKSVENNEFLEWAVFSGNHYGTKKSFVEKTLNNGNDLILEIDTQGAMQIKEKYEDAILIFILPPSREVLENRLRNRHTETEDAIQKRLAFVDKEIEISKKFDYTVVNDNLEQAVADLENIFKQKKSAQ